MSIRIFSSLETVMGMLVIVRSSHNWLGSTTCQHSSLIWQFYLNGFKYVEDVENVYIPTRFIYCGVIFFSSDHYFSRFSLVKLSIDWNLLQVLMTANFSREKRIVLSISAGSNIPSIDAISSTELYSVLLTNKKRKRADNVIPIRECNGQNESECKSDGKFMRK